MTVENKYLTANQFMFGCIYFKTLPRIYWNEEDSRGFIYFKSLKDGEEEFHTFHSHSKKLLDAIFNSVGLIRHAVKLVDDVEV